MMRQDGGKNVENPPPGTILDHTVTRYEFKDFFLVPQAVNQVIKVSVFQLVHLSNFWSRFYIVILGMTFFFLNQYTFSNFYLDFCFLFVFGHKENINIRCR